MANPMKLARTLCLVAALLGGGRLLVADTPAPTPDPAARVAEMMRQAKSLRYQTGDVTLKDGIAKISLPTDYKYLDQEDSNTLLSKIWHNPPQKDVLGMILPAQFDPVRTMTWVVVLSFRDDGYVKDDDAAKINYDDLLQKMKEGTAEASKEREKQGYVSIQLVGWATPPRYDAATHKLYWAQELKFGGESRNTLNYNIRMLGRRGVLVLNAVASMAELKDVEAATPTLLSMVDFQAGHRYADFKPSTDKVATYGIAALIAGGIAAKVGLLKGLWIGILALKKFIILGFLALSRYFKKIWDKIRGREPTDPPAAPPTAKLDPPAGSA
jgi:uncharacterized membrane-anchored protein